MTAEQQQILQDTEQFVRTYFEEHMPSQYVFHDLSHTVQTVAAVGTIAQAYELNPRDLFVLALATWFHDTGYAEGPRDHEERSCQLATNFLKEKISPEELTLIINCIRVTKVPQLPQSLLEQIICDGDLSHLGMDTYWDRTGRFRQELILTQQLVMNEQDWVDFELNFMLGHSYHTAVANELFNKKKAKHIQQLLKQKRRLSPDKAPSLNELSLMDEKEKSNNVSKILKESEKDARFGRGVETMYRTTYRTHTNLSQMADSKANLMLSVNAIVISIMASNILPKIKADGVVDYRLLIPTIMLILTCLGSMIYATLSTRPKVTEGRITREAIKQRKANLLFFGNFHNMTLDEFQWGVNEMLKDQEFLYSSMSRDLYFLGIVLAKKYQYLSICYNIFMYGLILSVVAFAVGFAL